MLVGRADDFYSKGIDIAAEALLKVVDRWPTSKPHPPVLIIRGVPEGAAETVKGRLDTILEGRVAFHLRPYSDSEEDLIHDQAQARVLLMPSRHEGFGLAAYEAIAAGLPVLISSESGLAQFLKEAGLDRVQLPSVTTVDSRLRLATDLWADAIQEVLDDPEGARRRAIELRRAVHRVVDWQQSATTLLNELGTLS